MLQLNVVNCISIIYKQYAGRNLFRIVQFALPGSPNFAR